MEKFLKYDIKVEKNERNPQQCKFVISPLEKGIPSIFCSSKIVPQVLLVSFEWLRLAGSYSLSGISIGIGDIIESKTKPEVLAEQDLNTNRIVYKNLASKPSDIYLIYN